MSTRGVLQKLIRKKADKLILLNCLTYYARHNQINAAVFNLKQRKGAFSAEMFEFRIIQDIQKSLML